MTQQPSSGAYPILKRTLGDVVCNLDGFDEPKVTGWVSGYNRILSRLVSEPDREWRQLAGLAS
jgi:hypothetical protein